MNGPEVIRDRLGMLRWSNRARAAGRSIGFVPTMGALHAGHAALIRSASADNDLTVVSVFVNPTQFGPGEDLEKYPRTFDADLDLCRGHGADAVFAPTAAEMYPEGFATAVRVGGPLTEALEGAHRPGHFDGVATVVLKLLNLVRPDEAVFGAKDRQQLMVIRRLAADLHLAVRVVAHATVREPDGLALSSRNRYLSPGERAVAAGLPAALFAARDAFAAGTPAGEVERALNDRLAAAGFGIDYASVRRDSTRFRPLAPAGPGDDEVLILAAVRVGSTRLIDNVEARRPV